MKDVPIISPTGPYNADIINGDNRDLFMNTEDHHGIMIRD